jgi:phenylacetate-coenzyme A ligase PaaK-like adenylate-forming protein
MYKLDEILTEWNEDSNINDTQISTEILKIPKIHAKYLKILNDHKMAAIKAKFEYDKMKTIKTEYYLGHLDQETLEQYGWEQFDIKVSKGGAERYLNSDEQLIKLLQKRSYHEQAISVCESIMKELNNRTWQLKCHTDYMKFLNGS